MIIVTSTLLSAIICKYEKSKIDYCDKMIFLGSKVMVLLNTTLPETEKIFALLNNCEKLKNIELNDIYSSSPLKKDENDKISDYLSSIGKFDTQTQINKAFEFCETFRLLKEDYRQYYSSHCKIIYALGFSVGCITAILLI